MHYIHFFIISITSLLNRSTGKGKNRQLENLILLPLWLKMPSISILLLEWAMQREPQGTSPSAAGDRSVVRTRHQSGLSWGLSSTSTVWPRRIVSSLLLHAVKSWMTTVSSQPPDNCRKRKQNRNLSVLCWRIHSYLPIWIIFLTIWSGSITNWTASDINTILTLHYMWWSLHNYSFSVLMGIYVCPLSDNRYKFNKKNIEKLNLFLNNLHEVLLLQDIHKEMST